MTSPEALATFARLKEITEIPPGMPLTIESLRVVGEAFGTLTAEPSGVVDSPVDVAGIPGRWIEPADRAGTGVLLYLHGGGYMMGSVASHRKLIGHIATAARASSLAIDYRLSPEHPYPAQVEDAVAAYRWLLDAGRCPEDVAIVGDSAGGGLTMLTLLRLRQDGVPLPAAAAMMSAWVDLEGTGESMRTRAGIDLMINAHGSAQAAAAFLGGTDARDPLVAPLHADLTGLPPTYLQVGDHESLLDDSVRLHARLEAAGVETRLDVFPEMQHVFQMYAGNVPESDDAVARLGHWLSRRLTSAEPQQVASE